jgi:transcriptional regulator with XRE-family HTH domain
MGFNVAHMDSTTYAAQVADNIRQAIAGHGVTIREAAERAGIPSTTMNRRLASHGGSPFTIREVKALADVLGVSASSLTVVIDPASKAVA